METLNFNSNNFVLTALFIYILYSAIAVLVGLLVGSAFVYQHWIEIALMYRNYLAKDETVGGKKNRTMINCYFTSVFLLSFAVSVNHLL